MTGKSKNNEFINPFDPAKSDYVMNYGLGIYVDFLQLDYAYDNI